MEPKFSAASNIQITEMNNQHEEAGAKDEKADYTVEEPFDYIFEPDHYPKHADAKTTINQDQTYHNGAKILSRAARMVGEKDGILEYEYKSVSDVRHTEADEEALDSFNDFDYKHHHLNAIIRGISLSKYPGTGFGFSLGKHTTELENYFYVNDIMADSPAEFALQLGDILIELDDMNPSDAFKSIDELHDYLGQKDNLHMMAIHENKYLKLKSENGELIRNYCTNCEDMVIVSWNKQFESNLIG